MTRRTSPALCAVLTVALAAPALASIPGNIEQRTRAGLQHVCTDTEPDDVDDYILCVEQEGGGDTDPYTASECTAQGLPASCVVDFIPKVRIKGSLRLIHDDQAFDENLVSIPATGIVVELKKGKKKATFIELFDGSTLGNWNQFDESFLVNVASQIEFTNLDGTAFQFSFGTLFELGLEVRDLAQLWFPNADLSNAIAVLTAIERDPKQEPLAHEPFADTLGSAASFKIVIEFARAKP